MTTDLGELRATINDALGHHLPKVSALAPDLIEAMRYAVLGNGKRIRPLLCVAAATGCGGAIEDALAPACALEYIHAYSLIHDDLPAMDDDDLRHGLPSCHIRFGEALAILAGDALQAHAFEVLANAHGLSVSVRLESVALLARASGVTGMAAGQALDMQAEKRRLSLSQLQSLHGAKTGALISAAVQIGAVVAGAEPEQRVLLQEFANRVGLAFQIIDDVLDVTASTDELGKPAGSDLESGKNTYPALLGLEQSRLRAEELLGEALPMLDRAGIGNGLLGELARLSVRRSH
ncbi:MAG: farnesyl diphosphate synthase [Pseudomonadota bacterium]